MPNLSNFDLLIHPKIVARGKAYFSDKLIEAIEKISEGEYSSTVQGSEIYTVYIALDRKENIIDHSCTCPYDWGEFCKHEVAILYYLNQKKVTAKSKLISDLRELLNDKSKAEMLQFLIDLAKKDRLLAYEFLQQLGYEGDTEFDCLE